MTVYAKTLVCAYSAAYGGLLECADMSALCNPLRHVAGKSKAATCRRTPNKNCLRPLRYFNKFSFPLRLIRHVLGAALLIFCLGVYASESPVLRIVNDGAALRIILQSPGGCVDFGTVAPPRSGEGRFGSEPSSILKFLDFYYL